MYSENLKQYDYLVSLCKGIERKGKTMPYTSSNGYMFSQLNKAGELGIRLPKEDQQNMKDKFEATIFKSYGSVMKDYVRIPDQLLQNEALMQELFHKSLAYVNSLPAK